MIKLLIKSLLVAVVVTSAKADPHINDTLPIPKPSYENFVYGQEEPAFSMAVLTVIENGSPKNILMYMGPIEKNTTEVITFFANQYPEIDEISLHSPGGVAHESFELGQYFSERKLTTTVGHGRICLSACAIAFIGGDNYKVDGILGYHSAYVKLPEDATVTRKTVNLGYRTGQALGAQMSHYFRLNGFHDYLSMTINNRTTPERFLIFTHENQLMEWFARAPEGEPDLLEYYVNGSALPDKIMERQRIMDGPLMQAYIRTSKAAGPDRGRVVTKVLVLYPQPVTSN